MNAHLDENKTNALEQLLRKYMDIFACTYKDIRGIPLKLTPNEIELDTSIPLARLVEYMVNLNYVTMIEHDINKLLTIGFIKLVKEAMQLSLIIVIPKNSGKYKICANFRKLNVTTKRTHTHYFSLMTIEHSYRT